MKLTEKDKAPDFIYNSQNRQSIEFYSSIKKRNNILIFLSHIGDPLCQMKLMELAKEYNKFTITNANIFVVLQSTKENALDILKKLNVKFTVILDPNGGLYRLYNVYPAKIILSFLSRIAISKAKEAKKLKLTAGKVEGNKRQLPATFIIDDRGIIKYVRYGRHAYDIPKNEELLKELGK